MKAKLATTHTTKPFHMLIEELFEDNWNLISDTIGKFAVFEKKTDGKKICKSVKKVFMFGRKYLEVQTSTEIVHTPKEIHVKKDGEFVDKITRTPYQKQYGRAVVPLYIKYNGKSYRLLQNGEKHLIRI